ncbi:MULTISPECIES: DUF6934 family protein [Spirosoma]|uniref:Uncharacterized protein n=1 Tax=Spirosoma sordidisoli TaxID=2502893 RepID=A0A4V1RVX7_9BACT|nr:MULTISPECIES: hypothetical protein [Spirosoma]RYC68308.1 hypothetical protein EQG79_18255 [Spirosoma sordidisoli]
MNEPAYPLRSSPDRQTFAFLSVSPARIIAKQVLYDPIDEQVVNLALVDVMPDGRLADDVVSDNQDMPTVIATVVRTMFLFWDAYPEKLIYIQGRDTARTRFYRILISRELDRAQELFWIYGKRPDGQYERFVPDQLYTGFAFQLKSQSV